MKGGTWIAAGSVIALLATAPTACSDRGDLNIENRGPTEITVLVRDDEITVDPGGGVSLLDHGCTPGDAVVNFPSGHELLLRGPVCPDQRIVVGDGTARLERVSTNGDA